MWSWKLANPYRNTSIVLPRVIVKIELYLYYWWLQRILQSSGFGIVCNLYQKQILKLKPKLTSFNSKYETATAMQSVINGQHIINCNLLHHYVTGIYLLCFFSASKYCSYERVSKLWNQIMWSWGIQSHSGTWRDQGDHWYPWLCW